MIRWVRVWLLRRRLAELQGRVAWIRDVMWSGQCALESAEKKLRRVQAELWCAESPRALLKPGRADPGITSRGSK